MSNLDDRQREDSTAQKILNQISREFPFVAAVGTSEKNL
jgi:hypothetical protein